MEQDKNNETIVEQKKKEQRRTENIDKMQDKLFRDLLSDKEEASKIINNSLLKNKGIKEIESKDIEIYNSSFVDSQYKNKEADIVYKMKNINTFFIIEHQSYMDYSMPYRMLEYAVELIKSIVNYKKIVNRKYPQVHLLVLYTGKVKWNAELEYNKIAMGILGKENGVNAKYEIVDIHSFKKEELVSDECIVKKVMAIWKCKKQEEIIEIMERIVNNIEEKKDIEKLKKIVRYIMPNFISEKVVEELLERLEMKGWINMFEELLENLEREKQEIIRKAKLEGMKEGKIEGKEEGKIEGKIEGKEEGKIEVKEEGKKEVRRETTLKIVKEMLKRQLPIELIMQVTGVTEEQIKILE